MKHFAGSPWAYRMEGWSELEGNAVYVIAETDERLGRDILAIASGRRQLTSAEERIVAEFCTPSIAGQQAFRSLVSLWGWTYNWVEIDGTVFRGVRLMPQNGETLGVPGARDWSAQLEARLDALVQ